jgi:spermidine synthase
VASSASRDHASAPARHQVLALLSGIPALVYEVIWTREVGLLAGSQVEGLSVVLAAFFGGLALGAQRLGALADRVRSPLRLYAALEAGAGALAALSLGALRWLGLEGAALPGWLLLPLGALGIVPTTILLGGTLPALLRSASPAALGAPRIAGTIVAANTAGAVLGVALAAWSAPRLGLSATFWAAASGSVLLGGAALWLGRGEARAGVGTAPAGRSRVGPGVLAAAALAGAATLAFEALAARAASLRMGSTLLAWAFVLGVVLAGLAAGNAAFARRASRSRTPGRDLGQLELGAAFAIAVGLLGLRAAPASPATGLSPLTLLGVGAAVLGPAILMGGAFPFLVRLAVRDADALGAAFGRVSAANTAGGIAGSLLAPLALLPQLGLDGGLVACGAANALLGGAFLFASDAWRGALRAGAAAGVAGAVAWLLVARFPGLGAERRLLFVEHGRQASAAVVRVQGRRDLYVDGDPEASTAGDARRTEQLLAVLPLLLHPDPRSFLEVGLGSGITLGTATRFPLERIDCVEISEAVIRAAAFFEPQNAGIARARDPRVRIHRADGRAFLARARDRYDVIVANTVHPWSVGATGLYSVEYFRRMSGALRPGGLAVQWLPVDRLGARDLAAVLRTFFSVFPEGAIHWGAGSLLAVGALDPLPSLAAGADPDRASVVRELGLDEYAPLRWLRLAAAGATREALGPGPVLSDDVPALEARAARGRRAPGPDDELELAVRLAAAGAGESPETGPLQLWLESLLAQRRGDPDRAARREALAEAAGLALARRSRADRLAARGRAALAAGSLEEAQAAFDTALAAVADHAPALRGTALLARRRGDPEATRRALERLLAAHPDDVEAWNLLASLRLVAGPDAEPVRHALDQALRFDPFFPEALANRGLLAARLGDADTARRMLERLAAITPRQDPAEERALRRAVAGLR